MLEKLFAQYPGLRSTTPKYDPCFTNGLNKKEKCSTCKCFVIGERFLGEKKQMQIMGGGYKNPYVLIADTVGCNLRCWFCYSHHYWSKEKAEKMGCSPVFLTPSDLANQFACKIENMATHKKSIDNRPITGLRISGGEPLYSNSENFKIGGKQLGKDYSYSESIDFWLEFFREMDARVKTLKEGKVFSITDEAGWRQDSSKLYFIQGKTGRIKIRFDTNGICFGDHAYCKTKGGSLLVAKEFIGGIYNLYSQGLLNNLFIFITYSIKGVFPMEYYWSQRERLDDKETELNLLEHPQYSGYLNLKKEIDSFADKDPNFKDVVGITVEKGINHDIEHDVFLYDHKALDWKAFERESSVELSEVKNDINLVYNYGGGTWGTAARTPGLAKRYFNLGATFEVVSDDGIRTFKENSMDEARNLAHYMYEHFNDGDYRVEIRPKQK